MEEAVTILFLAITFLSWLFSQLKENKAKKGNQAKPAKRPVELSSEIEAFLQEISGNKPPQKKKRQNPKPVIVKTKPPYEDVVQSRQSAQSRQTSKPKPIKVTNKKTKQFETNISKRHLEEKNYGSKLDQHVSTYMDRDIKEHVETHLTHDINKSVSSHLGQFSSSNEKNNNSRSQVHPVIKLFHNRESISQAIMLNEILSPPLSKRKK